MGSIRCWLGPKTNQNISSIFIYKLSNGIARGVWSHASMATYIYVLENQSAKLVGLAQGIQGTLALSSVPAGWVADKFRRDNVLKCCALADIGAIVCTTCAILLPETLTIPIFGAVVHTKFLWLCIALALWGLGQGAGPVSEALLADSTCTGSRAKVYSLVYSAGLTGMAFGPLTAAAAFAVTDNKWQISTLQHVILIGLVLALVPIVSLFCFDDDKALGEESDAAKYEPLAVQDIASDDATEVSQDKLQTITSRWATPQLNTHSVPYLLATSDLVFGLATGMTIKFFPIFFLKQVGLAPIATNFVMAATPLAVAAVAAGSPQLANVIGEASMYGCLIMCRAGCIFTMHSVASCTSPCPKSFIAHGQNNQGYSQLDTVGKPERNISATPFWSAAMHINLASNPDTLCRPVTHRSYYVLRSKPSFYAGHLPS
ncbi:TPA: hypothetical protein ACH3X1_003461 [Trebouxia sp. C0004]